jgi:acetyl esterase/lipase
MPLEEVVPWVFLAASLVGAWFTYNALHPMAGASRRSVLSFFAGWLTTELAVHHFAWQVAMTVVFVWAGALAAWPGWLGLAVTLGSWAGLARCFGVAWHAEAVVEEALRQGLGEGYREAILPEIAERFAPAVDWRQLVLPFPVRHPEVERIRDLVYTRAAGRALRLDVYRRCDRPAGCPTLLQVHGGAWILGSKNEQGIPLMTHLAARGWVCVSADYRLSPRATFPDHLIDLKRAVEWIRRVGPEYGADPDFLVVTGGSAGGHLASLLALTANLPEYQPGFEDVDTSLQGCVSFYGVYDFTDRNHVWRHDGLLRLLERRVMKRPFAEARDAYEDASPIARIRPDAPPFFVIHGVCDTLVPLAEARHFADVFRRIARSPIVYAEIPGAQHAFEIFPSVRSILVIHGVERFLAWLYSRHRAAGLSPGRRAAETAAPPLAVRAAHAGRRAPPA